MPAPETIIGSFAIYLAILASTPGEAPHWISEGPYLEEDEISFELPLEMLGSMPIVEVSINGEAHRFLFDTGSPSMINRELATQLGLEIIDKRQGRLEHVDADDRETLHSFGYPHTPFLDIQFAADARSKAMFDTGSQEIFTLSPPDFEGARRNEAINGTTKGEGSSGGSIGGAAPAGKQLRAHLASLSIGARELGRITAPLRASPPSLIGASVLDHFVVTLDTRNSTAWFDRYNAAAPAQASYGFGLGFADDVHVSLVWDDSPAAKAGLEVGDRIKAINGQATDNSCPAIRHALSAMKESSTIALEIEGESEPRVLQKAAMK